MLSVSPSHFQLKIGVFPVDTDYLCGSAPLGQANLNERPEKYIVSKMDRLFCTEWKDDRNAALVASM